MAKQVRPAARPVDARLPSWSARPSASRVFWLLPGDGMPRHASSPVVGALLLGTLLAMIVFGRRAQKAAYAQMEGQPGAAAAALRMLRGAAGRPTR